VNVVPQQIQSALIAAARAHVANPRRFRRCGKTRYSRGAASATFGRSFARNAGTTQSMPGNDTGAQVREQQRCRIPSKALDRPIESSAASLTVGLLVLCALVATLFLSYAHLSGV
jgi:hypothetical protein